MKPIAALDAIADAVLRYRPKPKTKPARRRKRVYVGGTMYSVPAPVEVEIGRLRDIEIAACALWDAHCKSHDAIKHPPRGFDGRKYQMNYGELVDLAKALGIVPREPAIES